MFDGATGKILYQTPNSNGTGAENPIIVDINGDGHANIIIASTDAWWGSNKGIRVFKAPNNDWIGTRKIWNQHSYNITNVGDDGSLIGYDRNSIWKRWVKKENLLGFRNNLPLRPTKECE